MRIVRPLVFVFGLVAALPGSAVLAPTYPSKPVRLIVTYPPAGSSRSVAHLSGAMFKSLAHVDIVHVPYKGGILSVNDLLAGHVQIVFSDALPVMQHIRAGKLRALAVTSPERSALALEIPTCV